LSKLDNDCKNDFESYIDEEEYIENLSCRYEVVYGNNNDEDKAKVDANTVDNGQNEVDKKSWIKVKVKTNWKKEVGSLADRIKNSSSLGSSTLPIQALLGYDWQTSSQYKSWFFQLMFSDSVLYDIEKKYQRVR